MLLHAQGLSCSLGGKRLFDDLDLVVNDGDRLGIVGHNGAGKSTLLKLLGGALTPDAGEIVTRRGLRVGTVEQFLPPSLAEESLRAAIRAAQAAPADWLAEKLLAELAFREREYDQTVGSLSGGQVNRLLFARALAREPELLLLDEPTNHLDIATLVTFEALIDSFPGAVVLISHDRAFLDQVTTATAFLRDQRVYRFDLPFSQARQELAARDEAAEALAKAQDRSIAALEASAKRLKTWGKVYDNESFSKRARSMERRVERLKEDRVEVSRGSGLELDLALGTSRSKQALAIDRFTVAVPDRELFAIEDLVLRPGERVALLGHNGTGKSTFIKALIERYRSGQPAAIRVSPQTTLGYYDQELTEVSGTDSLFDFFSSRVRLDDHTAHQRLVHAGFPFDSHEKPVGVMSGGERARLLFLMLSIESPNFLVLDEPTNHIDIEGKEQLEQQLIDSGATVLCTSHDRRFLERIATRYLLIAKGRLTSVTRPDGFFAERRAVEDDAASRPQTTNTAVQGVLDEDAMLARLVELEDLLAADLGRKAKFQKPKLQAAWRREIDDLKAQLEAS
ncbi:MAG: ABC-F family ATP-binding cassette domain-containing protein [Pseudomonadota bacterium]